VPTTVAGQQRTPIAQTFVDTIAYSDEFFIRYIMQAVFVLIVLQYMSDSETILNTFVSMLKVPGKSKFKHFLYDLGLRNALAVTFYSLCLYSSLMVPTTTFVAVLFFLVAVSFFYFYDFHLVLCG
jgi:hypothetical protein